MRNVWVFFSVALLLVFLSACISTGLQTTPAPGDVIIEGEGFTIVEKKESVVVTYEHEACIVPVPATKKRITVTRILPEPEPFIKASDAIGAVTATASVVAAIP